MVADRRRLRCGQRDDRGAAVTYTRETCCVWAAAWRLVIVILSASCAEPPNKEINQAQGAIDAARAAGADRFAAAEFSAATDALKRSEEAVAAATTAWR